MNFIHECNMFRKTVLLLNIFCIVTCGNACGSLTDALSVEASNEDSKINTMKELISYVREEIRSGKEEIKISTEDLDMEDIQNINHYTDGFYGYVSECESQDSILSDRKEITLYCDISDNYYVEQSLLEGKEIPSEKTEALALKDVCAELLDQMNDEIGEDASDYEKELWIHDYIVRNTSYGYPEEEEQEDMAHESYGALISHKAVCNGYAFAAKLLCDLSGVSCEIITGSGDGESHAWNLVKLEDSWYHLDVTWDDPSPDQADRIVYTYFNINDEKAALGHEWDESSYPVADDMTYNYYIYNDLYCEDYYDFKSKCIELLEEDSYQSFQLMVGDYDGSIYSDQNMDFIFDYTDADSVSYQSIGEIPYTTLFIRLE